MHPQPCLSLSSHLSGCLSGQWSPDGSHLSHFKSHVRPGHAGALRDGGGSGSKKSLVGGWIFKSGDCRPGEHGRCGASVSGRSVEEPGCQDSVRNMHTSQSRPQPSMRPAYSHSCLSAHSHHSPQQPECTLTAHSCLSAHSHSQSIAA